MSSILSWIGRELECLILALILFLLVFSGFGVALLLRFLEYNGVIIAIGGILVEGSAMVLCYLIFKTFLKREEGIKPSEEKGKKLSD